jgi:16S rRNA (guanine527-N7)-methyltransferase
MYARDEILERVQVHLGSHHAPVTFTNWPMPAHLNPPTAEDVARHARAAGSELAAEPAEKLARWLGQLVEWNTHLDLTAARSQAELLDLMIVDALVLSRTTEAGATVVDVGTGAGAPGLALAVVRPDLRVTLVEPLAKRVSFLRAALATIAREDVGILRMKAEELRTRWDVAIARATFPPPEWLDRGADLVVEGGSVWVLLARDEPPSRTDARIVEDVPYAWPGTDAPRRAVCYRFKA